MEKCLLGIKCRTCSKTKKRTIVGQSIYSQGSRRRQGKANE